MGRKKKDEEILEEEIDLGGDEELELELGEADDSDEDALKEPASIEADSLDEEIQEPKAPRKRAPRKPKVEPAIEETPVAAAVAAAPVALPVAPPVPAVEKDAVVLQWEAAKLTTEAIVASLDKVNGLLRELPDHYAVVLQKSMKASAPRSGSASKIAFGTSLMAILLSVLSLSFSQSARQAALSHGGAVQAVHRAAAPTAEIDMLAALENVKSTKAKKSKRTK